MAFHDMLDLSIYYFHRPAGVTLFHMHVDAYNDTNYFMISPILAFDYSRHKYENMDVYSAIISACAYYF